MTTIATWNVNSLRVRLPHLTQWLESNQPDIVALQETKVEDANFPIEEIQQTGYQVVYYGQKTYNGVAILSKFPIEEVSMGMPGVDSEQKRILGATINGIRIWNLYVPNGSSLESDKYDYKLSWLSQLTAHIKETNSFDVPTILLGDFNIAPEDQDVREPKAWEGNVLVSAPEREALQALINLGFKDSFRLFPQEEKLYSWWDYRQLAFRRNRGLRIDHILASNPLAERCQRCWIDKEPRKWERPSDHAPVIAEFDFP